jgi:hypothetical protein
MLIPRAATVIGAALALLVACSAVRSESDVFATLQEARAAGAIERGWVPAGLPEKTTDLRDAHVPSGTHWGLFSFEWWPRLLRTPIDVDTAHEIGLHLYMSRDARRVFAINWNQGKGYYWSVR